MPGESGGCPGSLRGARGGGPCRLEREEDFGPESCCRREHTQCPVPVASRSRGSCRESSKNRRFDGTFCQCRLGIGALIRLYFFQGCFFVSAAQMLIFFFALIWYTTALRGGCMCACAHTCVRVCEHVCSTEEVRGMC